MVTHRFAKFLENPSEYARAVDYWVELWERVDPLRRLLDGWKYPWLSTTRGDGSLDLDGNPIFSAFSPIRRKAVRVIQHPPTTDRDEFDCWEDTFGGPRTDPEAIWELVIACALSDEAANKAIGAMRDWVDGKPISIAFAHFRQHSYGVAEDFASMPIYVGEPGPLVTTV
jgi:hypothetical protein